MIAIIFILSVVGLSYGSYKTIKKLFPKLFDDFDSRVGLCIGSCGISFFVCLITNPRSQGCPRFQSGEELANSVGKINA